MLKLLLLLQSSSKETVHVIIKTKQTSCGRRVGLSWRSIIRNIKGLICQSTHKLPQTVWLVLFKLCKLNLYWPGCLLIPEMWIRFWSRDFSPIIELHDVSVGADLLAGEQQQLQRTDQSHPFSWDRSRSDLRHKTTNTVTTTQPWHTTRVQDLFTDPGHECQRRSGQYLAGNIS